jgi:hypothetical protein
MVAPGRLQPRGLQARQRWLTVVLALLALASLAGCQQAQQVGQGVDKAKDCATVLKEIANLNLDPQSVARAAGQAADTANRLNDAARNVDQADVRRAAEDLGTKVKALADKANNSTPAQLEQQIRDVTQAATRLASTCNVPIDQVVRTG